MATVHITQSVALSDGRSYTAGTTVDMSASETQEALSGGWAETLGTQTAETPEANRDRRGPKPERRAR